MSKQNEAQAKQAYWQNHIEQWKRSGLSQIEYCRKQKINKHALGYWIRKKINTATLGFVQLPIKVATITPIEIRINNRFKIMITSGFDAELLKNTIKALEEIS